MQFNNDGDTDLNTPHDDEGQSAEGFLSADGSDRTEVPLELLLSSQDKYRVYMQYMP